MFSYTKGEPTKPCILCKGTHFNDCSDKFYTVESRKGQLSSQGRYFIVSRVVMFANIVLVSS